ncbi:MAG: endonuclease domain-containing protein [Dehalococcoidia bacterium]
MDDHRWHQNNVPAARHLRRPLTPTEETLWAALRNRGTGWKFRRQHPIGVYVLDFYCHQLRLAIEVDGAVHGSVEARREDAERQAVIEEEGVSFVRFQAWEVEKRLDWVLTQIDKACSQLSALTPTPLPEGEGLE